MLDSAPRRISGYETLFELGSGGMGTAFLARAVGPGGFERLVVIKRMHQELMRRREAVARFLDEARLAACVRHANVVSMHQVGHDEDGYFLVLEYVEGPSLEELVDRAALKGEVVPAPIALRIALDACAGLHAAHNARDSSGRALGLLHRDISLQNLLVGRDGMTRVVDFGVAKSALGSVTTGEGMVIGKLLYLAPEYLRHEPVGPELDVYALGVTLWIVLAGRDPWPSADDSQVIAHILGEGMPPLASATQVAPQVAALVDRACDPEPSARFPTARAMSERIEAVGRETGWVASHAEVADYVERLAGTDLERRREVVSRREHELGIDVPARSAESAAPIPLSADRARRVVGSQAETLEAVVVAPRRRVLWPLMLALAAVSAIGGAALVRASIRAEPSAAPSAAPASSPALASTGSETALQGAPSGSGPVLELPQPVASEPQRAPAPLLRAERRAPPTPSPLLAPAASPTPARENPPKSSEVPETKPSPDGISTANPYRKP